MKEKNIIALYETLAKIFSEIENCKIDVTIKKKKGRPKKEN
jgi:hypothetical protein